jgi:hypothetical protein
VTKSRTIDAPGDSEAVFELFDKEGFIDGHPIIEPTEERVAKFLQYVEEVLIREPSEVLGLMAPAMGETTIEKVAINAVMAGCRPEYMAVVLPAAELLVRHGDTMMIDFGSHTQHQWLIVNGPIRHALGIQTGEYGSTGASWRPNATIMRALRLLAINCGGRPGVTGKRTFGYVGASVACLSENEEASPWEPYHVERGFDRGVSTVTLMNVEPPKHIELGRWAYSPAELLAGFADSMSTVGNRYAYGEYDVILILGKDHANTLAAAGFSKADVKRFLHEHARTPYGLFGPNARDGFLEEWKKFYTHSPYAMVPMTNGPEHFHVFVCGGPGPNSLFSGMQRGGMPIAAVSLGAESPKGS